MTPTPTQPTQLPKSHHWCWADRSQQGVDCWCDVEDTAHLAWRLTWAPCWCLLLSPDVLPSIVQLTD